MLHSEIILYKCTKMRRYDDIPLYMCVFLPNTDKSEAIIVCCVQPHIANIYSFIALSLDYVIYMLHTKIYKKDI